MAQDTTTKQFLDYNGLSTLWNNIKNKFATKGETITSIEAKHDTSDNAGNKFDIIYKKADGSTPQFVNIPLATTGKSGLMSSGHYAIIEELKTNIENTAPFAALQLDGTDIQLTNRKGNIKLEYINGSDATGDLGKTYIALKDATTGGTAVTKLDITSLIKQGFLKESDVVINPQGQKPGTYLMLVFSTGPDGTGTDTVYINVTDLVEIYNAGDGIDITYAGGQNAGTADDNPTVGTISVKAATDDTIGGIKTGYSESDKNYAVKVVKNNDDDDPDNGKAYVNVPWTDTITNVTKAADSVIDVTGGTKDSNGVKTYILDLTDDAKSSLNAGKSAIQTIIIGSKELTQGDNEYTVNQAKADLKLGTASNSNRVNEISDTNKESLVAGETQKTVPTTEAVMAYVSAQTQTAIEGLDSEITAGTTTNSWPDDADAADKVSQALWKKIVIKNGRLDEHDSVIHNLVIADITDFRPLNADEINEICVLS